MKERIINYNNLTKLLIENENITAKLISDISDIPYKNLHNNIELIINNNFINKKSKEKKYIVTISNERLIDINKKKYQGLKTNNYSYSLNLYSKEIFNKNSIIIQINLNTISSKKSNYIDYFELKNNKGEKYIDNFKIITLDIIKCHKLYYKNQETKNKKIIWGALIYSIINNQNTNIFIKNIPNKEEIKRLFTKS